MKPPKVDFELPRNEQLTKLAKELSLAPKMLESLQRAFYVCLGWSVNGDGLWFDPAGVNAGWPEVSYGRLDDLRIMRRLWEHHLPKVSWKLDFYTRDERPFVMEANVEMRSGSTKVVTYAASKCLECALPTLFLMVASSGLSRSLFQKVYLHPHMERLLELEEMGLNARTVL